MIDDFLSANFFEAKYADSLDPWDFECSAYEQMRYDELMKSLGKRRFYRAFEPGCSVGVLTERLLEVCDEVIASDISAIAVSRARSRCSAHPGAYIQVGALPGSLPAGPFDLIVFSEVGYYFTSEILATLAGRLTDRLTVDGVVLAAHWLGSSPDHLLTGDEVHAILATNLGLKQNEPRRHKGFRIDLWSRA